MQTSSSQSITVNLDPGDKISTEEIHVLPNSNTSVSFRFLRPGDQVEVKTLCKDWFPIEYPDLWYDDIVHESKYFSLAACETNTNRIVGLVVADVFALGQCNREDQLILHKSFSFTTPVCYILILGVVKEYRRQGLAGILLQNLISTMSKSTTCKAIYLHVLYSNKQAIQFYESKQFQYRAQLPHYYCINGENFDGFCFALYVNGERVSFAPPLSLCLHTPLLVRLGGYPPFTVLAFIAHWWAYLRETSPCRVFDACRHFLVSKLMLIDYQQRASPYKQISRIV